MAEQNAPGKPKLALIHTGHVLIPLFGRLCRELMPDTGVFHMLDESAIQNTIATGSMEKNTIRRVLTLIGAAHDAGAGVVLVTCSSIGPAVDIARQIYDFPVVRVDEPLAEEACRLGRRIGVVATLRSTLEPTTNLLRDTAARMGRAVEAIPCLCEGAYDAILAGNAPAHDAQLWAKVSEVAGKVDVVVLAQASMAGVLDRMPAIETSTPIVASPELAVRRAREVLRTLCGSYGPTACGMGVSI